jgi:hypothetical protein
MKNKNIIFITIGVVAMVIIAIVLVIVLTKKQPTTTTTTPPVGSTGTGTVSSGGTGSSTTGTGTGTGSSTSTTPGNSTVTLGNGQVAVIAPQLNATQPYATTAPRVEPKPTTSTGSTTPLNSGSSGSSGSTSGNSSGGQVASANTNYNYNQSDNSFVQQYYPDANTVINGQNGPAGNAYDDPADQIIFTTGNSSSSGPQLTAPSGFDTNSLKVSQDSSYSNDQAYLSALQSTTAVFDIVNNTGYITQPLQDQSAAEANSYVQEAQTILAAIQNLTVPGNLVDLQASYVAAYQQYIAYGQGLSSFLNSSSDTEASLSEGNLQGTASALSQTIQTAIQNYQAATTFYTQSQ